MFFLLVITTCFVNIMGECALGMYTLLYIRCACGSSLKMTTLGELCCAALSF